MYKKRIFLIVVFAILLVGCISVYCSNKSGMFVFNEKNFNEIIDIENKNKKLDLKELSSIVFTIDKENKSVTDMGDLELIHAAIGISTKYIDTITGTEIEEIVKKYFNVNSINLVDITCDLPMSDYHDNRMYIYNPNTDRYESNPEHISHNGTNNGIIYKIVNERETTEDEFYVFSGEIFYVYNECGWELCGSNNVYDVYLSYGDVYNKTDKQFNAYEKEGFCSKKECDKNKIYESIKEKIKTVSFYYKKKDDNYVFDHYELK